MKIKCLIIVLILFCLGSALDAQLILPLRERAAAEDEILKDRLDNLLPALMRKAGIDMWIVIAREYNEDPVASTMLPATWLHARRRTILLFSDKGQKEGVERLAVYTFEYN
jgi:hypothetical protein